MEKYIDTIIVILLVAILAGAVPITILKSISNVSRESFDEKKLSDLCYKIETEKRIDIEDFFYVSATVEAYDDRTGKMILTSWAEIKSELENNGTYRFYETHVRVIYDKKMIRCIRVN